MDYYTRHGIEKYTSEYFYRNNPKYHTKHITLEDLGTFYESCSNPGLNFVETDYGNFEYYETDNTITPFNGTLNQWCKFHDVQEYYEEKVEKIGKICGSNIRFAYPLLNYYTMRYNTNLKSS